MKKLIKNVVSLDMTKATPESVKGVTIGNAVRVIVTPTTRPLLGLIKFGNLVTQVEIPDGAVLSNVNGNVMVNGNEDTTSDKGTFLVVNGKIVVKNDVSQETLCNFFSCGADINGSIFMPDTLVALFPRLNIKINGAVEVYKADSLLFTHNIQINNGFLSGLPTNSKVTIIADGGLFNIGNPQEVVIATDTDLEIFERHISELTIFGDVIVPQHLAEAFYKVANKYGNVTVIPEGYTLHDQPLIITSSNLIGLKGKSLYTRQNIIFKENAGLNKGSSKGLDKSFNEQRIRQLDFHLETQGCIIMPESIADVLLDNTKATNFYTYSGQLVIVNEEMRVSQSDTSEMASYLVNEGAQLSLSEEISEEDIQQGIGEIFLYGNITLREKQSKGINFKLVIDEGNIETLFTEPAEENNEKDNSNEADYDVVINNAVEYSL